MTGSLSQDAAGIIPPSAAWAFAREWEAAWNARDVDRVLAHFDDEASFSSPIARRLGHGDDGRLVGKSAIHAYWSEALTHNPHLHFTVTAVHLGISMIVIEYRTQDGTVRAEVLSFREGRIIAGHGTLPAEQAPAVDA